MIKKIFTSIFLFGLFTSILAQPYAIGHRQHTFIDVERQDRMILTEIYYPATAEGDDTPVAGQENVRYPLVVFGHGFVMEWGAYSNIWKTLVLNGYVIAFPRTETGLSPNHLTFGQDLAFLVKAMQMEGASVGSPFWNRVDSTSCVMGHSMGGGSSFLAVQFNEDITAVVNFAAAETNPSAIGVCSAINIPSLVFAGGNDCITPPESNQVLMYDSLDSTCKTLVLISGASHCQFAEQNVFCSFGELTCTPAPDISRSEQHRFVDTLLIPWLDYHLKGQCMSSSLFQNILTSTENWTFYQSCEPCFPVNTKEVHTQPVFQVYPLLSSGSFFLKSTSSFSELGFRVFNTSGNVVHEETLEGEKNGLWQINVVLIPGVYFIQITYASKIETLKMIIQ